jgi:hypothetical protein
VNALATTGPTARLFDRYVAVDWSANSVPKRGRDSIWVRSLGAGDAAGGGPHDLVANPRTRAEARVLLRDHLVAAVSRRERVLVGFDVAYGYPAGFAAALGLDGTPWRATWDLLAALVHDGDDNGNDRFTVASELHRRLGAEVFWGHPHGRDVPHLSARRDRVRYAPGPGGVVDEWRATEQRLRARGHHPHQVWKLYGAGSVGSQALLGIPTVAALRDDPGLAPCSRVWPFEVGVPELPVGAPAVVHAEVWPSLVDLGGTAADPRSTGAVRDRLQVEQLALHLCALDDAGDLAGHFAAAPADPTVTAEEGWILGS